MDPLFALIRADQFVSDLELLDALELIACYRAWRARGGFQPSGEWYRSGFSGDAVARDIERRITDATYAELSRPEAR